LKSNISFFIEALDEFSTRQVKSLITKIALETSILSLNSIIPHTPYHAYRKSYHNKLNQFNQRTTIPLNKRKKIILIGEMRSKKNLPNPTPNMQSIRRFKK